MAYIERVIPAQPGWWIVAVDCDIEGVDILPVAAWVHDRDDELELTPYALDGVRLAPFGGMSVPHPFAKPDAYDPALAVVHMPGDFAGSYYFGADDYPEFPPDLARIIGSLAARVEMRKKRTA